MTFNEWIEDYRMQGVEWDTDDMRLCWEKGFEAGVSEKDVAEAAEREACVTRLESLKDTAYQNNLLSEGVTYSCAIEAIRSRTDADSQAALERVKREARNEALRKALETARAIERDHGAAYEADGARDVRNAIEALIEEQETGHE